MTLKQDMKVYYEAFPESLKYCDFCTRSGCTLLRWTPHAKPSSISRQGFF